MSDYGSIKAGEVVYPLPTANGIGGLGASLLRDADPSIYFTLEFFTAVLQRHVGPRLMTEAIAAGATMIQGAVGDVIPFDPEPYLLERHTNFPLLAAVRKSVKFEDIGGQSHSVSDVEVVYTLPPLQAGEAERLIPILKMVVDVLHQRTAQGMDPAYRPTGGTLGQSAWNIAGVAVAEVRGASIGSLEASDEVFFPSVVVQLELKERTAAHLGDFEDWNGANVHEDIASPDGIEPTYADLVEVSVNPAPTLASLLPVTGSKAGGTAVTLTGTGFVVGTTPIVLFGGQRALNVVVASTTSITCVTPDHSAYPTALVDVEVINIDGQSDSLVAGFTFTSP
jgi:hypothetical protein